MSAERNPIERMIDEACGVPADWRPATGRDADNEWLILLCPECGKFIATARQPQDPPSATLMVLRCPECNGGDFDSEDYFDAKGRDPEAA